MTIRVIGVNVCRYITMINTFNWSTCIYLTFSLVKCQYILWLTYTSKHTLFGCYNAYTCRYQWVLKQWNQTCLNDIFKIFIFNNCVLTELTPEVMQEKIDNIQRNLTVNRKETNQYIRTLTSAPDERRSARNIGIVGVSVICGVFGVIILSDCTGVIKAIQSKCGAAKDRWRCMGGIYMWFLRRVYTMSWHSQRCI